MGNYVAIDFEQIFIEIPFGYIFSKYIWKFIEQIVSRKKNISLHVHNIAKRKPQNYING